MLTRRILLSLGALAMTATTTFADTAMRNDSRDVQYETVRINEGRGSYRMATIPVIRADAPYALTGRTTDAPSTTVRVPEGRGSFHLITNVER
jgi:hypothetical protein